MTNDIGQAGYVLDVIAIGKTALCLILHGLGAAAGRHVARGVIPLAAQQGLAAGEVVEFLKEIGLDAISVIIDADHIHVLAGIL